MPKAASHSSSAAGSLEDLVGWSTRLAAFAVHIDRTYWTVFFGFLRYFSRIPGISFGVMGP